MNEQTELWQRQLEQATRRHPTADETLDAETADLREGWLALGSLLEAADEDFAEQTLPVQIQSARHQQRRRWLGIVALAASLLLAVSAAWIGLRSRQQPRLPSTPEVAGSPSQSARPRSPTPPSKNISSPDGEICWDDAWDEKLAQLDQSFVSLCRWSDLGDTSLQIVDQQLQQISQEMNTEL